ncbi:LOW QUALITY PROTEIN: uncharacterized protein LOC110029039 [Phalaenopsis equestris]|uniref:LOW QUALITY PROTEIN: uncharacterized protein LOC110029039 n=1 Tax=Phalaenopsis equestris TaxID=78828 RepID=UPI0009E617C5|nr:LOW QUALITY PROTEIN: uncharacterized protein LOC110029039 [Phalaenopsis equestris]
MEKEIRLLSQVAANHLFLGQFEALRANLLSLKKRKPVLALEILRKIISEGGRIDGILWSSTAMSSSDLAWLCILELPNFDRTTSVWSFDAELLRLKAEFILLIEIISSTALGSSHRWPSDAEDGFIGHISERDRESLDIMKKWMHLGLRRLKSEADYGSLSSDEVAQTRQVDLNCLWKIFLDNADIFSSLCWNIQRQLHWFEAYEPQLAISVRTEDDQCLTSSQQEVDTLSGIQKEVQMAHLAALREDAKTGDILETFYHIRFLHLDYGIPETEYKSNLQDVIRKVWSLNLNYGEDWKKSRDKMALLYVEALSSNCIELVNLIQLIQDELFLEEIEKHRVSNSSLMPLPLQKYLETLKALSSSGSDIKADQNIAIRSCKTDLYHYARLSGVHILECVMDSALSAVKRGQLQVASDVLSLFPLLQPLVAVLGWDLLSGRTAARRKLMQLLWTSKSQVLRMEEYPLYGKKDEISCVEYQCDLLCFHLDVASFVACINSGRPWNSKASLLFSHTEQVLDAKEYEDSDSFVENFILERLSVETPMRVLFDVVPEIKFQDAIELLSLQPIASTAEAWKRMQDIELMQMRYALESVLLALGAMEDCLDIGKEGQFHLGIWLLKDAQNHIEAINNIPRKIYVISIVSSLLHMDDISVKPTHVASSHPNYRELPDFINAYEGGNKMIAFIRLLLDILRHNLPNIDEVQPWLNSGMPVTGRQALEWRVSSVQKFIEDWEWRLSILQRLEPLSKCKWSWKEVLVILRAAPSKLLNLCMQRAKYDLGEEAVHRFSLPAEDKAALDLAEWVAGAFKRESMEDIVARVAENTSSTMQDLNFSSLRAQLGPLAAILLCMDVAVVSAKSVDMCKVLLGQARDMLAEIYPGNSPKTGFSYWDQIQEVAIISVTRHVLQRLHGLVEQDSACALAEIFIGETAISCSSEGSRLWQRQRALLILHQMIDDAHTGKRQFLSGKLHNLARAVVDEDSDGNFLRAEGLYPERKLPNSDKGAVLGLGLKVFKFGASSTPTAENNRDLTSYDVKDSGKRLYGPLSSKPSTYLSSFIIYIATIGDIVDGIDTTHDFNFFSLIYEWPKDLLIRLVFERGSTDAAGKVADIMGVDFVHEVIAACVPPVFPPRSGHGFACVPVLPSLSRTNLGKKALLARPSLHGSFLETQCHPLYPLQLNVVKHLANLSPVRAVLACVFGCNILSTGSDSCISSSLNDTFVQAPDTERLFYELALDQSERFPTLNRWIQMQSNLHRVSESAAIARRSDAEVSIAKSVVKVSGKRTRDPGSDTESEIDDMTCHLSTSDLNIQDPLASELQPNSPATVDVELTSASFLSFDWENEAPYAKAVERLINEGKLMDALALSDRCLRNGASDQLLQLLIDRDEKNPTTRQPQGYAPHNFASSTWQYCIRLKDKKLAARLALKYLHRWELNAAIDVLTMCSCHLSQNDPIRDEVLQKKQALQRYNHILCADDHYSNWQEVEADCKEDPEGLALRLAGKGAVSAALEVAESASLSIHLRRELQGRQLVKLLTADPLSGGGPAEASRFLSSLRDSDDALPAAVGAMQLLPDLQSKQLLVHFFLKRQVGNLSEVEVSRLNAWALGLRVLALLPLPSQQRCSALHEHPHLILEVLLMMKQLQSALLILKEFPSLRDDKLILTYASKAISINVNSTAREPRISILRPKPKPKPTVPSKSNFTQSIGNLQKEARRAFSWAPRDVSKNTQKDLYRKRKSPGLSPPEKVSSEAMSGIHEERTYSANGQERLPFVSVAEEWVLTGDPIKDAVVRSSHKYETSPDITLFKALLTLCSSELVSAKGAFELCVSQMKIVLSSQHLPLNVSMETIGRVYHATETYVQALAYAKSQLRKLAGNYDLSSSSDRSRNANLNADDASSDTTSSSNVSQFPDEVSMLLSDVEIWLGRAELLQSLLGSGIVASLDDIADKESSDHLRDRLIQEERYSMAVYTCKKCKIDGFPVWNAWGRALIQMEHYTQARIKFKQALQLYKGDPSSVVLEIINMVEGGPPVEVSSVRSMYDHLEKSAPTILDDSLSADAYLNVLYIPSTFPRSERSRSHQYALTSHFSSGSRFEGPHSHLDNVRYGECIYYLQEYARPQMLGFMFRHGRYADACSLFFPLNGIPNPPHSSPHGTNTPSSSPQRQDPLATDYGTIDDLCDLCIGYGAMSELEGIISMRSSSSLSQEGKVSQYIVSALARICNYCETHRNFNYLYEFQVLRRDHIAAGLCCIQLFMNSSSQEEAVKHLEHAKVHFEEGLSARHSTGEITKILPKFTRGKSVSNKLSEEELIKLSARVGIQVEVVKSLNDNEGPQWRYSLFGNPSDPETFRRRCVVAETLAEKHFDLAFKVIYQFNLPAVDIYASVAASLAERKRGGQLTEFLRNIKGTIDEDDWDQVLGAAINVYANRHKERPDRLIDMLISSHRKVLACVICGRLKSAFQIASRSGSVADVQYVAHQASYANALPVLDMCKQWLSQYM